MNTAVIHPSFTQGQLVARNYAILAAGRGLERLVWILILLFYSGAIVGLTIVDTTKISPTDGAFARLLWYFTYGLILALTVFRLPKVLRLVAFNPLLIICVLWCGITYFWSIQPSITFRRTIALLMTTMAGMSFAARYDWSEMIQTAAFVMLILCLLSVFIVILSPERGIQQEIHEGAWRGPWLVKNQMGGVMAKGVAIALCAFAMQPKRAWLWIPTLFLCFAMVLLTTSKTSLLVAISAVCIFIALRTYRRFFFLRIPVIFICFVVISGLVMSFILIPAEMLALIGKDPTLTGRTDIWSILIDAASKKYWLGYGYGTFWVEPLGPSYQVTSQLEWQVPTAHNGWFDSWLSGGMTVIILFSMLLLGTLILGFRRISSGGVEAYWVIISLFFFVFFSMSESTILQQNDIAWFLFVATASKLWAGEKAWWRPGSRPYIARLRFTRA